MELLQFLLLYGLLIAALCMLADLYVWARGHIEDAVHWWMAGRELRRDLKAIEACEVRHTARSQYRKSLVA